VHLRLEFAGTHARLFLGDAEGHCGACHDAEVGTALEVATRLHADVQDFEASILEAEEAVRGASAQGLFLGAESGYLGDEGPARAGQIYQPNGLALGPEGEVYISDYFNYRVRKVDHPLTGFSESTDIVVPAEDGGEIGLLASDVVSGLRQGLQALGQRIGA